MLVSPRRPADDRVRPAVPGRRAARAQWRVGAVVVAAALLVLGGFALAVLVTGVPFKAFSKEPVESLGGKAYVGWLANAGSLVWGAGGAVALFAAALLRGPAAAFLLRIGLLTAVLTADDLFLLHESVYPRAGVPEEAVYLAYAVATLWLLSRGARVVLRNDWLLLAGAFVLLGTSVAFDGLQEHLGLHLHAVEDGAKVVGVALWAAFLVTTALREVRAARPHQV